VAPRCVRCGHSSADLPAVRPGGRICLPCYRKENKSPCARCGRLTRAAYRRPEGLTCGSCRDAEPAARGTCPGCGQDRPLRRGRDRTLRCERCTPRPLHVCVGCGTSAPAAAGTTSGPVCARCYQQPQRRCGGCGQVRVITVRATAEHPDLCRACRPHTAGTCAGCGRHTFGAAYHRGRGPFYCQTCQPKTHHTCIHCGQDRPAHAIWPAGPVCGPCHHHAKNHPGRLRKVRTGPSPDRTRPAARENLRQLRRRPDRLHLPGLRTGRRPALPGRQVHPLRTHRTRRGTARRRPHRPTAPPRRGPRTRRQPGLHAALAIGPAHRATADQAGR